MRIQLYLGLVLLAASGAAAGTFVGALVPAELSSGEVGVRAEPYSGRWTDEPFVLGDARRLPVPFGYGDFDLQMEVELGEGATVDLLARVVEPRILGSQFTPFHGRFSVLRMSADRAGPAWLSREAALLGDREAGGVDLAPGVTASVWLEGRGRQLTANVAGKLLPEFTADDRYGSFLLVARGGKAVVRSLTITPMPRSDLLWVRGFWIAAGAVLGLLVGALALALAAPPWPIAAVLVVVAWAVTRGDVTPLWHPPPSALLMLLLASGCAALCLSWRRSWLALVAASLVVLAPPLSRPTPELDAVFGPDAGSQLSEAHAQLVRGQHMIHDAGPSAHRVFLLGGQLLYDHTYRGAQPPAHLETLLAGELAAALGVALPQRVDVPCLPTVDGHGEQQWDMFARFYAGYRPQVIVFGLSDQEGEIDEATGRPRSHPSGVERALGAARSYCAQHGSRLVLLADEAVPQRFVAALQQAAGAAVPFVQVRGGESPTELSERLAAVIAPLMQ